VAISWNGSTLVGFENHGGRTYLGTAKPLGRVLRGHGNNAEDHTEGAVYRNAYGTYLHGSLLPKNPHFADHLLALALERTYGRSGRTAESLVRSVERYNGMGPFAQSAKRESSTEEPLMALTPLDDRLEWEAHAFVLERMGLQNAAVAALRSYRGSAVPLSKASSAGE